MKAITTLARKCQTCSLAIWAEGAEPVIICTRKKGSHGRLIVVRPQDSCANCRPDPRTPGAPKAPPNDPNARYIPLTQGRFAIVDAEDYQALAKHKWYCSAKTNRAYAMRRRPGSEKRILMHRWIMNAPDNLFVDHIDGNGLNNRKTNLRLCTPAQNARNRRPDRNCHSKYKGVTWGKLQRKWLATISKAGNHTHLGCFKSEIEAATAYDRKAQTLHAQFAYLNFPELAEFRKHARNLIWPHKPSTMQPENRRSRDRKGADKPYTSGQSTTPKPPQKKLAVKGITTNVPREMRSTLR